MNFNHSDIIALSKAAEAVARAVSAEVCRRHGNHIPIDDPDEELSWKAHDLVSDAYANVGSINPEKLESVMHGMYTVNDSKWLRDIFSPVNIYELNKLSERLALGVKNMIAWS